MIEWLASAAGGWAVGKSLDASARILRNIHRNKTRFLNHDPRICNHHYHLEDSLGAYLPYRELFDFSDLIVNEKVKDIHLNPVKENFFTQCNDRHSAVVRAQAYHAYRADGHANMDSKIVRINEIQIKDGNISMVIQPTRYFCQAESNLILDFEADVTFEKDPKENKKSTLREIISNENPGKLPELSDRRLANTLGVAICLLSREGDLTLLRMVHRTGDVGVFPKGVHPAMSCAINWNDNVVAKDLMSFLLNDIEKEMLQETGLKPGEYEPPVPLSICREYLRGGKPQLFVISYTDKSQKELNILRDEQIKINKRYRPDKVEMKASGFFSSNNPSLDLSKINNMKFTHEGAACYFLVNRLLEKYVKK